MQDKYIKLIAEKLGIREIQVKNTAFLFSQGATVPFISRYRKEQTGTLNDVQVAHIVLEALQVLPPQFHEVRVISTSNNLG